MKKEYVSPQVNILILQLERMVSTSQTSQGVYTDDPQTAGAALVKGRQNYDVWDDDWSE